MVWNYLEFKKEKIKTENFSGVKMFNYGICVCVTQFSFLFATLFMGQYVDNIRNEKKKGTNY